MNKIRNIPYGYTYENGSVVIEETEADVIKNIFLRYVGGESLTSIAVDLHKRKIPYTERSIAWDKARIMRILENLRYSGDSVYAPIIDEELQKTALAIKQERLGRKDHNLIDEIAFLKDKIKCGVCGATMCRRTSRKKQLVSWTCYNDDCRLHMRIEDHDLIHRIGQLMMQIADESDTYFPKENNPEIESLPMIKLKNDFLNELERQQPDEEKILEIVGMIASLEYDALNTDEIIEAKRLESKLAEYEDTAGFSMEMINDTVDHFTIDSEYRIVVHTKYGISVTERITNGRSKEDTEEDNNGT